MIIGFVSFIVFLFVLYILAKDDFVFIRKSIALDEIFNTVFFGVPFVIFSARLFYTVMHPKWIFLNPFVFFLFPYFPGLFTGGGIVGGVIFLYFFTKKTKIPFKRVLDDTGLAFLCASSCYYLLTAGQMAIGYHIIALAFAAMGILYLISFVLSRILFLKEKWLDGNIGIIAIIFHSVFSLLFATMVVFIMKKLTITPENIFYIIFLLIGIGFLLKRQYVVKEGR